MFYSESHSRNRFLLIAFLAVCGFVAMSATAHAALTELDSSSFGYKYEMNLLPSDEDLDGNSVPDFTLGIEGSGTASVSGGVLTINSPDPDASPSPSAYFGSIDAGSIWPGRYAADSSYTVEMRMKAQAGTQTEAYGGQSLYVITPNNYSLGWFNVSETAQTWRFNADTDMGGTVDNTDTFHDFRLAYDAPANQFHVWRDGVLVGEGLAPATVWSGEDRLIFGDLGGYFNGAMDYDYVRFTDGAYVPVGGEIPIDPPQRPGHIEGGPVVAGGTTPYAWYRADQDVVTHQNTTQVAYVGDQSGNDRHIEAKGDPQLTNNGAGGEATITLDGEDDYLESLSAEWGEAAPGTVFAVWKRSGGGDSYQTPYLYDGAEDEQRQSMVVVVGEESTEIGASGSIYDGGWTNNGAGVPDSVGLDSWAVTSASYTTGSTDTLCINGEVVYTGNLLSGGMTGLRIGGYVLPYGRFWEGDIGELIVFEGELSAAERSAITQDLMGRWGVETGVSIPGDANKDGVVDADDAATLAENWQTQGGATWAMGDFNGDGNVDDIDATLLASNWATGTAASASVPEPSTITLLIGSLIVLLVSRKRYR